MLEQVLKEIDDLKKKLDLLRPLNKERLLKIKKCFDLDQTYNSNAIEGSTLTFNETKLIINEGLAIGGKSVNEHLEVINHQEALSFLEGLAANGETLTQRDVNQLHYLILKGIDTKNAGVFRKKHVGVRKSDGAIYSFVDPLHVSDAMCEFITWTNEKKSLHPVIEAAEEHYRFVSIHPYVDGNGRTARLLMNLVLIRKGYVPALIRVENRAEYILGLEQAQESGDMQRFYEAVAMAELESMKQYLVLATSDIELI